MDAVLERTLVDAVSMLESRAIPFAVIGGLAVSFRGQPRMTVDVDLVMQSGIEAALQLLETLGTTPFEPLFAGVEEVVTSAFILPLRHRTTGVRVDIAIGLSGFEQDAVSRAMPVVLGSTRVPVATVEDLLVMKALAGRPQDDQDIRGLVAAGQQTIDWERCLAIAEALGSAVDLDLAARLRAARAAE